MKKIDEVKKIITEYDPDYVLEASASDFTNFAYQICQILETKTDEGGLLTVETEYNLHLEWKKLNPDTRLSWRDYWLSAQRDLTASILDADYREAVYTMSVCHEEEIERKDAECQERMVTIRTSLDFANRIAIVMDRLKSSSIYFVIQQAFGDIEWEEAQDILNTVIEQTQQALKKQELNDR